MSKIKLEKMRFFAHHGFFEEERRVGAEYEVSVTLDVDIELAGRTDDLNDTLNYQQVYDIVKQEMTESSHLIEHVSMRIMTALKKEVGNRVNSIWLSLSKINPPLGGQVDRVTIELEG
ncbi:MAG: dihydroneopterin aldolase [Paludibacteraceae bacterium]|nr:dihydroneopterin aldolase [Paludibacteraceae bacterium]